MSDNISWIRITKDWTISYFENQNDVKSPNTKYWVKVFALGRTHTTSFNNTFNLFEYEIFDSELSPSSIDWQTYSIYKIKDTYANMSQRIAEFHFRDCTGITKVETFSSHQGINNAIFKDALQFLFSRKPYMTWKEYDLGQEVMHLKAIIEELETKLKNLEN